MILYSCKIILVRYLSVCVCVFFLPIKKKKKILYSCIKFRAFFDSLSLFYSVIFDLKRYVDLVLILHNATL